MEKLPRQVYTREFRQQAVEMITRDGLNLTEAARPLDLTQDVDELGQAGQARRLARGGCPGSPPRGHGGGS